MCGSTLLCICTAPGLESLGSLCVKAANPYMLSRGKIQTKQCKYCNRNEKRILGRSGQCQQISHLSTWQNMSLNHRSNLSVSRNVQPHSKVQTGQCAQHESSCICSQPHNAKCTHNTTSAGLSFLITFPSRLSCLYTASGGVIAHQTLDT